MELTGEPLSTAADWGGYLMARVCAAAVLHGAGVRQPVGSLWPPPLAAAVAVRLRRGFPAHRPGHARMTVAVHRPRVRRRVRRVVRRRERLYRRHQRRHQPREEFRLHRRGLGLRLHAGAGDRRLRGRTLRRARAVLRGRRAGAGQRGLRLLRAAGVIAASICAARSSGRAPTRSAPSAALDAPAHRDGSAVRRVPVPGGARLAARGVDVLHAAQVRLGAIGGRLVAHLRGRHDRAGDGRADGRRRAEARRAAIHHAGLHADDGGLHRRTRWCRRDG